MLKLSHQTLIIIAGMIWLGIGVFLLSIGLKLIVGNAQLIDSGGAASLPLLRLISPFFGGAESAGTLLIALSLLIGYFKGRFVLIKSANRAVKRICSFPAPVSLHRIYSLQFLLLIGIMMTLGMLIRVFNVPQDIRGVIDVIVGSALINGSLIYFRLSARSKKAST